MTQLCLKQKFVTSTYMKRRYGMIETTLVSTIDQMTEINNNRLLYSLQHDFLGYDCFQAICRLIPVAQDNALTSTVLF